MKTATSIKRVDVPVEQTWNREAVFPSWDAFQQELDDIIANLPDLSQYAGRLGDSSGSVADYLETVGQMRRRAGRLYVFTLMAMSVDTDDAEAKAKWGQVMSVMSQFATATAFAEPELLAVGDRLGDWVKQDSRLRIYAHYFDNLQRRQQYTQTAEVETVLGMLQDPFNGTSQTYHELTNTDMKFREALDNQGLPHPVVQATGLPMGIESGDRVLRRNTWESFCDQHRALENTLASNLITSVKQHVFLARVRGYQSVLESRLVPTNMPLDVFYTLIDTFKDHLPVWHRYWAAKRQALGVDQLQPYDIWAPLVEDEPQLTYQQAAEWICAGLDPLGDEYVSTLRRGMLEERWVDYAQNEGRAQGAFAGFAYGTPPFVFNTFDGRVEAMSVLAHELGHAMHSYLMDQHQPEIYNAYVPSGTSMAVAETASNFHQAMVRAYLKETKADDKRFQLVLINEAMDNFHRYFFIMPMLARFELEVYSRAERDQPLNARILNDIMGQLFAEGYGDTMTDDPDRTAITWGYFQHLYTPFYTFQYAIGISAAHALAERILVGEEGVVPNYLAMLKAGWSMYAPDLFKCAGVDMSRPEAVVKTFGVLERLVASLESLVRTSGQKAG